MVGAEDGGVGTITPARAVRPGAVGAIRAKKRRPFRHPAMGGQRAQHQRAAQPVRPHYPGTRYVCVSTDGPTALHGRGGSL